MAPSLNSYPVKGANKCLILKFLPQNPLLTSLLARILIPLLVGMSLRGILKDIPAISASVTRTRKRLHEGALEWVWKAEVATDFGVVQLFGAAEVGTVECATLGKVIQTNKSHTVSITQSPNNPDGAILTIEEAA